MSAELPGTNVGINGSSAMEHKSLSKPLEGTKVALTGRLASMTHREATELVGELGGSVVQSPTRDTQFLVIGQDGLPLGEDGTPTANLLRARKLKAEGYAIELVTEDTFLHRFGLLEQEAGVHRRYSIVQLSRILGLPRDRIRCWMRSGFIEPVETVNRLALFDYQQVTTAKMLYELVGSGLMPPRIRDGLERLRQWLPGIDSPLSQLSILESSGRLVVRLEDGQLAEPNGQLQIDFEGSHSAPTLTVTGAEEKSVDDWFDEALRHEEAGQFDEALAAYRVVAQDDPDDPVLHFNLGNVLYSDGKLNEAVEHFRKAVELDSSYVEAWNNLGNLLAEQDRVDEAILALRYALSLVPTYADAHFNLAAILDVAGFGDEARQHWQAYLRLDPASPWADEARKHLDIAPNS
ncbi:MAG: tetratricopeptide repeat protein [Pirellulales bacterium]